jgi:Rieske 2Fe-2S family protein
MTGNGQVPAAPVDQAGLAAALRPFGESVLLPPAAYTDPAVFSWERRHFLDGGWTCAGFSSQLPGPGDQRAAALGPGSALLVRGADGRLRAFANTCRHRGHELLPCDSPVQRNSVICPYHSWTYSLAGDLRFAGGLTGRAGFDRADWGLAELPVTQWHGLVFVDGSGRAAPLEDALRTLDGLVAPYEPERLVVAARQDYDVAANWKTLSENYHECYHCPAIHPELCRVSPPSSGGNYDAAGSWAGGWLELRDGAQTMSLDGVSLGVPLRGLSGAGLRTVAYVHIFPNVLLSLHPDYVMTHRLVPLAADRTLIECTWAFPPEALAGAAFDPGYAVGIWDITNQQDWQACESVQRGLAGPHAAAGPLAPDEAGVYQLVTMVARGYLGQPVANQGWRASEPWLSGAG